MYFTRYEIREYSYEDNDFTYTPFDTLAKARAYAKEHNCSSTDTIFVGIYKIRLYPTYDMARLVEKL